MGFLFALGVVVGVVVVVLVASVAHRPTIGAAEARLLLAHGAQLIDVRTPSEFAAGHIDGARNVPLRALDGRLDALHPPIDKTRPAIVYCKSGVRSRMAARKLKQAGYAAVHNLGGMSRWQEPPPKIP